MAAESNLDLKYLFRSIQGNVVRLMQLAEEPEDDLEAKTLKRRKTITAAQDLIRQFVDLEEQMTVVAPQPTAADMEREIKSLEEELREKNALIRKVQSKLESWTKELRSSTDMY